MKSAGFQKNTKKSERKEKYYKTNSKVSDFKMKSLYSEFFKYLWINDTRQRLWSEPASLNANQLEILSSFKVFLYGVLCGRLCGISFVVCYFFWRGNSKIVLKISKFKSLTDVWCTIFLMSDERGVIFLPLRWKVSITNFRFYCIFMSHLISVKFFLFDIYGKFRFLNNVRNSF